MKRQKEKKWNILACNRRSKYCMSPLVPDEGNVFISQDLCGAEPNIMLNLTDDPTLKAVLYDMKGKPPVFNSAGVLLTDNLYITTMSTGPLLKPILEQQGDTFLDMYAQDSDAAKGSLGKTYTLCKQIVLAALYGMGAARLSREMKDVGVVLTVQQSRNILESFWESIPEVKKLKAFMTYEFEAAFKAGRPFQTPFGFILPTQKASDALNYLIQSSVSAWVRRLNIKLFSNPYAKLIAVIHDELVVEVKEEKVSDYKIWCAACVKEANDLFGLTYPLQLGWKVGRSFADFK